MGYLAGRQSVLVQPGKTANIVSMREKGVGVGVFAANFKLD